ncbi:lipoyl(octanoyl) transferase LipB [Candidatus Aquarickettsia rohweri]|uniref:Octanoyltransferase n=1 Tax=Candidatus Aquarickettsia rohweri TaxID=2602574 RepID=A0A429XV84_9RICK|nr:lipoyl(octanoyl) transferase LipB [Candidatus Aquarickettsia rohweri]MSO13224.1 Octanoyltransferase [Rickettsiales endosymbiont of Trichoplax sp. H2]RST72184.1 lipoyl(octanoyl) transferase [Candidatus Aquarickettsia rohweri]
MHKIDFIYSNKPIEYEFSMKFMKNKVEKIISSKENQAIWLLEHPNIYTLGRSAVKSDIKNNINIPYIDTDRGGKITYHGPGQKIIYIMLNLKEIFNNQPDIKLFINMLGKWIITILNKNNILAYIDNENIGVWVKDNNINKKIASIGIKLKKWISYHGIALNINPNMSYFNNINPCGILNCKMTSIYKENNKLIENYKLNEMIKNTFLKNFNFELGNEYKI